MQRIRINSMSNFSKDALLARIRNQESMTISQQIWLTVMLSAPAILAQLSSIVMQYIDASMLGRLGAREAASVGLVSTSIWLIGGLGHAATSGFSVQVAHRIGSNDFEGARNVLRQAITTVLLISLTIGGIGMLISPYLPIWLGGDSSICHDASLYFLVYTASFPFMAMFFLASGMLRCSGNMKVPSILSIMLDVLDIIFNFLLIFPTHHFSIGGVHITIPGADLGVLGAALGTAFAIIAVGVVMFWYLLRRSPELSIINRPGSFRPTRQCLKRAFSIGSPIALERVVMNGAQIAITAIVAPLGPIAIAANSFAITAESLCYMPGYGISDAATTLVGQSIGARRPQLTRRFANITLTMGIGIMTLMGAIMYVAAPLMMRMMSPDTEIITLGTQILRIEAFAEPMFAAAIVCYGIFVGAGDTLKPCIMNFASIWLVRLTLSLLLVDSLGLVGVWIAMCTELCFRGIIFLARFTWGRWDRTTLSASTNTENQA